jgi:tRNA-modifying protein YgfZ
MSEAAADRTILSVTGPERTEFLQGLVTNDVGKLSRGLVYAAMLTPQGKYLADFLLVPQPEAILIDVKSDLAEGLARRLAMYKLRAKVEIAQSPLHVHRGLGEPPADGFADPRHPALGWRAYRNEPGDAPAIDWDRVRAEHCIPETGIELIPDDSYILESGFDRLNGVDFRKGCYVGQEVTARMKHKTELKKGLVPVTVDGSAPVGTEIVTDAGKPAGKLFTQSDGRGIAYLRLDRAEGPLTAEAARVALAT